MACYKIAFKPSVRKDLRGIPRHKVLKAIDSLPTDPNPLNAVRLTGRDAYRLRVRKYRVIYAIDSEEVVIMIIKIGHRRGVYR